MESVLPHLCMARGNLPDSGHTFPVLGVRKDGPNCVCVLGNGSQVVLAPSFAINVQEGDEVQIPDTPEAWSAGKELYVQKSSTKHGDLYHAGISYAALPRQDKRGELFVQIQVPESKLGIEVIQIPCTAVRDYFFSAKRDLPWSCQPSFYYLLHLPPDVLYKELRLAYRLRRMELLKENASRAELNTIERAYNMLADPDIRAIYDGLRKDPEIPVPFPYSGFGAVIVRGERNSDGTVFFANRLLAYTPERRRRSVAVPLRKLEYFEDYAIWRDRRRKLEVLIDQQLLPIRWDPTWSQWRHHISATIEIEAEFIHTGRFRQRAGEWKLIEWDTALPSRTEAELPDGLEKDILKARATYTRFGKYWLEIDTLRKLVEQMPIERVELRNMCARQGLPADFDVAQLTWRPDYDAFFLEQLNTRARTMFVYKDEYLFDLEHSVVAEMPKAGHATYVFAKPGNLREWVLDYAKVTRQDIRLNRDNIAEVLGFRGRIVHGKSKSEWLKDLGEKIGEPPDASQLVNQ